MTPPNQDRAQQKRQQFVEAAARVIHRQGYVRTTLADIAADARLPTGSLYYYFKTKDEIVAAIIDERLRELERRIGEWERNPAPKARLQALIAVWIDDRESDARYGCPIGSLCYELAKSSPPQQNPGAAPLRLLLRWSATQFAALGAEPLRAEHLALHLLSALQGVTLIANAFQDPQMILDETAQLQHWLQTV